MNKENNSKAHSGIGHVATSAGNGQPEKQNGQAVQSKSGRSEDDEFFFEQPEQPQPTADQKDTGQKEGTSASVAETESTGGPVLIDNGKIVESPRGSVKSHSPPHTRTPSPPALPAEIAEGERPGSRPHTGRGREEGGRPVRGNEEHPKLLLSILSLPASDKVSFCHFTFCFDFWPFIFLSSSFLLPMGFYP